MNYPSIEIQNLLSENLLDSLGQENSRHKFAQPESFSWEKYSVQANKKNNADQIAGAYENLIARWDLLSSDFPSMNLSDLREKWIKYFFSQFGFDLQYQKSAIEADSGNKFVLSYRGWEDVNAPIVHSSSFQQDLDDKPKEKIRKYSPHDTLQRFLNQSNSDLWGIVTNGKYLRILRDFSHQSRKAYIQFDLEILFERRYYEDFRILWRLLHPSRFIPKEDEKCILENLFEESKNAGIAIGEDLRKNISLSIESLANGFLLATPGLLNKLVDNTENCMEFYQQILRIIYRVLFLFYAEQRRLMPSRSTLYAQEYSMSSLRDKIEKGETFDEEQFDLWEGLKATFNMVYHGVQELGITSYNGQLFNPDSIHWLINSQCRNDKLLIAIKYMSLFEKEGITHRISYIELNVDEIGAIYEGLLEYMPRISSKTETIENANKKTQHKTPKEIPPNTFFLDPRGTSRKTSGSYYTHPGLVNALIKSALVPVVETKVKGAGPNKDLQEEALLSLKICDPACGSAAFLIAATEYLGEKLAKIRIQDEYPTDTQIRHARRDVLRRCIYGVDLNPMAVELGKVSLWLTAATNDLPLNFLDHKIKYGNSLIGTTPELIKKGIPPEAYSPVEGDDKNIARKRMKIAREYYKRREQERYQLVFSHVRELEKRQAFQVMDLSEKYGENSTREQKEIEKAYKKSREDNNFIKNKYIADFWTAAFFWKHNDDTKNYPTQMILDYLLENETVQSSGELGNKIKEISEEYKFFHWHLEFPEVFTNGGFDCVLGNPPWERIKLQEKEFFRNFSKEIVSAKTKYKRSQIIEKLKLQNLPYMKKFIKSKRLSENLSVFVRRSGIYQYSAAGDINTYPLFTELSLNNLNRNGSLGLIIPSGIATDEPMKEFFAYLIDNKKIVSLYDFENRGGKYFPTLHTKTKYCLITLANTIQKKTLFGFYLNYLADLHDSERIFSLSKEDLYLFNPNTKNCPIFKNKKDYKIVKVIYENNHPLVNEQDNQKVYNTELSIMFMMSGDSNKFEEITKINKTDFKHYLPLYEGKMIEIYNPRFSSAGFSQSITAIRGVSEITTENNLKNPFYSVTPRFYVKRELVPEKYLKHSYFVVVRKISDVMNRRTFVSTVIPLSATSDSLVVITLGSSEEYKYFLANSSSIVFDYIVRQKLGGKNLTQYVIKQLPFIDFSTYNQLKDFILHIINRNVIELIYTSENMRVFAHDLGYKGDPFVWDSNRRQHLTCEIDAIYAHLYGISKKNLSYILETFLIVKNNDVKKYHEYRTKRLILEKYDELKDKFKNL